jgi:hypothetical protein
MTKIVDPDSLNVGTELVLDTSAKTIRLVATGNLVAKDGVTLQALYSKLILLWETATYNKYPFPIYVIDAKSGQYQFGTDGGTYNGWKPYDDTTRTYLRDGGWSEYSNAGVLNRQYVGIVSLGDVNSGAQLYYQKASTDSPADFTFTDEVNEGIQVYGDATNGNFDKRSFFKGFVREYSYKYKDSVLADTGQTGTGAYTVNLLLSNEADLDVVANDATAGGATAPWNRIKARYFSSAFGKEVDSAGNPRSFGIVIDVGTHSGIDGACSLGGNTLTTAAGGILTSGNPYAGGTLKIHNGSNKGTYTVSGNPSATVITIAETFPAAGSGEDFTLYPATTLTDGATGFVTLKQIYTKIQYLLRQNSDIDETAGTVTGKTASLLLNFVGSELKAGFFAPSNPNGGGSGVIIEGIADADVNSVTFYDNSAAARQYPYASAGSLDFNSFLSQGGTGYYRMYFTALPGANDDYGESGATTVNNKDGNPIAGAISGSSISFNFDYSGNVQGGRTAGQDAAVTVVAGNKGVAKPVVATGTITQSKAIKISLTAEQDRAYSNP